MNSIPLFEKFTEQARKVMRLAQEEAQRLQHNAVGTEHILLGLVREGTSIAAHVLESLEITPDKMRKTVEELKGYGDVQIEGEPGLTLHANMAIEIAMKEAERQFLPPGFTGQLIGSIYIQESEAAKILQDEKLPQISHFFKNALGIGRQQEGSASCPSLALARCWPGKYIIAPLFPVII